MSNNPAFFVPRCVGSHDVSLKKMVGKTVPV